MVRPRQNCIHGDERHAFSYPVVSCERVEPMVLGTLKEKEMPPWVGHMRGSRPWEVQHACARPPVWPRQVGVSRNGRQEVTRSLWKAGGQSTRASCMASWEEHVGQGSSSGWGAVTGCQLRSRRDGGGKGGWHNASQPSGLLSRSSALY